MSPKKKERTCPECKGSGMITRWYTDRKGIKRSEQKVCGTCHGSGTV